MSQRHGTVVQCRRSARRFVLPNGSEGFIDFDYPKPGEHHCEMPLKDLSNAGLSFVLIHELPGLAVGRTLQGVALRVDDRVVRGDLLICHLTSDEGPGAVCGGLFYPASDPDLIRLQDLLAELTA
jgi:hypothetical protein